MGMRSLIYPSTSRLSQESRVVITSVVPRRRIGLAIMGFKRRRRAPTGEYMLRAL